MAEFDGDFGGLEAQLAGLETTIGGLESVTGAFRKRVEGVQGSMKTTGREASGDVEHGLPLPLRRAFEGVAFDGKRLSDALAGIGRSLSMPC